MAEIIPFKGLIYDSEKIGNDYSKVVAPPYDVISPEERDELYSKSGYNIVRLILSKSAEGDSPECNKYTRASEALEKWETEGVLARDEKKAFYIYSQEYKVDGKRRERIGFFALMKIGEAEGDEVLPHEYTLAKPKADRMNLIKEVRGNLSSIFSLYDGARRVTEMLKKEMISAEPVIDIQVDGVGHKFWRLGREETVNAICSEMADKKVFIADGHHRYEVAKAYRDLKRNSPGYDGCADYIMMYFSDLSVQEALTVFATHRIIKSMPEIDENEIRSKLNEYFSVSECCDLTDLAEKLKGGAFKDYAFGFFNGEKYLFMESKDNEKLIELISEDRSVQWKSLDVSILHSAVLDKILAVKGTEGNVAYLRRAEDAVAIVKDGSHNAAFFLRPTRLEQLKAVAELGEMMPQKSTYFYPKLLTGLVINKFTCEQ
ncbi:MAG: DUF1015 domain-containing protein [Candidatus Omnitrophica bacterium]|nr:DUF1015 domain-containing protein [Candidatus Omnitrophota bacterium]